MNILITGGCGFIGSHFIRHMISKYSEYSIVNLDNLTYAGNLNNTKDFENNKNYKFVKGDICDKKLIDSITKEVNAIINFAAETHVDRSIIEAGIFVMTDVIGTHVLLEAARKNDIPLLQISTDEVYGSTERGSFKETDNLQPSSLYSASKASADLLVRAYNKTYGLPILITRSSNNYGPYQHPEKLIPLCITNLIRNKNVPIYGDGMNVRDWLFVNDNCKAIDLVFHKGKNGEVYNIASGREMRNIDIVKMILALLNKSEKFIEFIEDRKGHDRRYSLDFSKIRELDWVPESTFEDGLKKTVDWYLKNTWWWKPLVK